MIAVDRDRLVATASSLVDVHTFTGDTFVTVAATSRHNRILRSPQELGTVRHGPVAVAAAGRASTAHGPNGRWSR